MLCSHPQCKKAILLLVNLRLGSLIKGSARTWFFSLSVQTPDSQLWKCITNPDPFVHFACDSHQQEKNSWKWKFTEKAHTKTIYRKCQLFHHCISLYFSITLQYSILVISLHARAQLGLKSDIFQPKLQMWYHQLFHYPTSSWGRGHRITELLQSKSNPTVNHNTQNERPGLSSAGEELVSSFIKHHRKLCTEKIRRYPQPRCIKQFSCVWNNGANYRQDFSSV